MRFSKRSWSSRERFCILDCFRVFGRFDNNMDSAEKTQMIHPINLLLRVVCRDSHRQVNYIPRKSWQGFAVPTQ